MTVHDDDAECGLLVQLLRQKLDLSDGLLDDMEESGNLRIVAEAIIASRLSPTIAEGVLREALKPFAEAADYYDTRPSDEPPYKDEGPYADNMVAGPAGIRVKHYRQARAALEGNT